LQTFGFAANTYEQTQWANSGVSKEAMAWTIFVSYLGATNVPDVYKLPTQSKLMSIDAYTNQLQNDGAANVALSQGGTAAASARALITGVTSQATAATFITNVASNVSTSTTSTSITGSTFTLTTSVDSFSGTTNNDTFSGLVGASGTFTVGDNLIGGGGTDTLNITDAGSATAVGYVELSSVETVNVRMLSAGTTILNANGWSGTTKITNASSVVGSTLNVTGVETSTNITISEDADINIGFRNTTTATNVISVTLSSAGNLGTASTLASAAAGSGGTANIDIDIANVGLVSAVSVSLIGSRTNFARLEAGSNVLTYTLSGDANAVLVTDDTMTSFDASQAKGNIDVTFDTASDVNVKGGAGNDTFRLGATLSSNDRVDGGAGTNIVTATVAGFNRSLNTTNVQSTTITFNDDAGGTIDASASTITTFNLVAGSAGADSNVSFMATGSVVNLATDAVDDVALGYSSVAAATINIGSASGAVGINLMDVSGVASLTINGIGGTASAGTIDAFSADATLTSITIQTSGGEADLTFTTASGAGVRTLNILANGSAAIVLTSGFDAGSSMTSINVVASGDAADVTLGALAAANTALSSVVLTGNSAGDVTVGALQFGNGLTADAAGTLTLNAANGSVVGTTAMDVSATGSFSLTIAANVSASGTVGIGDIVFAAGTASTAASANSLTINAGTIGNNGSIRVEKINFEAGTAGQRLSIGTVVLGTTAGFEIGASGISAVNVNTISISTTTITVGNDSSATVASGGIFTTGGAVGAISLTVADSGSARYGIIFASSVGAISATVSGDGEVDLGGITGTDAIGNISLVAQGEGDIQIGAISGSGTIGTINIGVEVSASAVFSTVDGTSVGAITVSGAGAVIIGTVSAAQIGTIDATQMTSGTFTIDISGVVRAAEVRLGAASANTVISGIGNDIITLLGGKTALPGNDNIRFTTATQGTDDISNFIGGNAASGGDVIQFGTGFIGASGGFILGSAIATDASTVVVALATTASGAITIASGVSVILINATAFASTATFVSAIATGGSLEINLAAGGGGATAGSLIVVWQDAANNSYVSIVGATAAASGTNALIENGSALQTVAVLTGVTPGALVAANFDFV